MATIYERKYKSGNIRVRVMLRKRGHPAFYLTFEDWDSACDWVEKNEDKYFKDPQKYFLWKEKEQQQMRRNKLSSSQGMTRAQFYRQYS